MIRKLFTALLFLLVSTVAGAQNFSTDAKVVAQDGNTVTVRASGMAEKKKDAQQQAIKSAFHTLFHVGMDGVKDGTPMMAVERKDYDYRFYSESRFVNFITTEVKNVEDHKVGKNVRVTVQFTIDLKSLIADIQLNKIPVSPSWGVADRQTASTSALKPTIVIVPFVKSSQGTDFESYRKVVENTPALKFALDRVTQEFSKHGYKTRNFISQLRNAANNEMMRTDSQTDVRTMLTQQLPGDIIITVGADIRTDGSNQQECNLSIEAVEAQTNGNLAVATFPSGKYYKGKVSDTELVEYAVKNIKDDFFAQMASAFERMVAEGREVYMDITLSTSVTDWDFDQDSPATGDNFKDALDEWLREHAHNSVYDMNNNTDKYIHVTLNVPLWNQERGRSYTLSNFSSDVKKFFKAQFDDAYKATVTAQGQKLEIIIK